MPQKSIKKGFLSIFAGWRKDPDPVPYLRLTDPDSGGLKTSGLVIYACFNCVTDSRIFDVLRARRVYWRHKEKKSWNLKVLMISLDVSPVETENTVVTMEIQVIILLILFNFGSEKAAWLQINIRTPQREGITTQSSIVYVSSSELACPTPVPQESVCPPSPHFHVGGGHTRLRWRGWGEPFRRPARGLRRSLYYVALRIRILWM